MYRPLDQVAHDLRFALRQFRRAPALACAAVLALGCGIGGMTTVFTLVDAVLLRPLPVAAPGELVSLRDPSFSYPMFEQMRDRAHMLRGVFAWTPRTLQAEWTSEPEPTSMALVTGAFHDTLGLQPAAGRLLNQADVGNTAAEAQAVAVLSYSAWQQRFGGDPAAIGRSLRIEGQSFTIIGVTPRGFFGVAVGMSPDVTIPVTMLPRLRSINGSRDKTGLSWLLHHGPPSPRPLDRLRPTPPSSPCGPRRSPRRSRPTHPPSWRARYLTFTSGLEPAASGYSPVREQFQAALWLLFGLVALVLVVACATVANLLLAAAAGRRRELALRLAIGASRARLVQQLFVEGLLLATAGGALGCLFATWSADLLVRLLSTSYDPVTLALGIDGRALAFTACAAGIVGDRLQPRPDRQSCSHRSGPGAEGRRVPGGRRSPARGYRPGAGGRAGRAVDGPACGLGTLRAQPDPVADERRRLQPRWPARRQRRRAVAGERTRIRRRARTESHGLVRRAVRRLRETPGVRSASLSRKPPISNELGYWFEAFSVEGQPANEPRPTSAAGRTFLNAVSPGYFETVGTPFIAGRDFSASDVDGRPPVTVINASMATKVLRSREPHRTAVDHGRTIRRARASR